jgi:hypothetical protein
MKESTMPKTFHAFHAFHALLLLLFLSVSGVSTTAFAAQVPQELIKTVANNFLQYQVANFGTWAGSQSPSVDSITLVEHELAPIVYNVSVKPNGFLLIPYYDEFSPVVLFSKTARFEPARVKEANSFASWILPEMTTTYKNIQRYRATVEAGSTFNSSAETPTAKAWAFFTQPTTQLKTSNAADTNYVTVGPLLSTRWDQGDDNTAPYTYNLYTPAGTGERGTCTHTVTGCVATAWSQVLRYWQWPAQGSGSHSYSWNGTTLSRDFSQSTYDWANMPLQLTSTSSQAQIEAVARLISDVGIAVDMDYGCASVGGSGSEAYADNQSILPVYFGYKTGAVQHARPSYNATAWFNLFKTEFDAVPARPIIFSVFDATGGHEIVADGYQTGATNYVHVNMGWSGSSDGYYNVDGDFTAGYTWLGTAHVIVTGIQPVPFTVTPSAGTGGSISPATVQSITGGSTATFSITPNTGFQVVTPLGGTCPQGSYNSTTNSYTSGKIVANCTITAAFTPQSTLTVNHAYTSAGAVKGGGTISGSGISCSSVNGDTKTGICAASFNSGSTVTLAAGADANSTFSGWSGGCTGSGGCTFAINANTTVTGSFAGAYKAKISGGNGYDSLTLAHANAGSGATILARQLHNATTLAEEPFVENLTITKPVILKGGYNAGFSSNTGIYSTLSGILTIGGTTGSLTVENLIIK